MQEVLTQILPGNCSFQHAFKSGATVDAVIRLGDRLVPIDAKFPLESYKKMCEASGDSDKSKWKRQFAADVKKHADAIADKYILPDENTYDFALMYMPSESIYYEIIGRDTGGENAADYAVGRKVIPVSPNTIFAYLQTVMLGLRGLQVEERAAEIVDLIGRVRGDVGRFTADFETLGTHLKNAVGRYDEADKRLNKLSLKLDRVESLEAGSDP
jgi:DNA recombination protein RmuC